MKKQIVTKAPLAIADLNLNVKQKRFEGVSDDIDGSCRSSVREFLVAGPDQYNTNSCDADDCHMRTIDGIASEYLLFTVARRDRQIKIILFII